MALQDPEMSKLGTGGKTKQSLIVHRELGDLNVVKAKEIIASYSIGSSAAYDIKKWSEQLQLFVYSSGNAKYLFKGQTMKEPKLVQLD
jgi:hypothetical protein